MAAATTDEIMIRFPPFPSPPQGVKITPFAEFKETGIQMFCLHDDGIEVDGSGIPTVELNVKHNSDKCKTNARRMKKEKQSKAKVPSATAALEPKKKLLWWEVWQEEEPNKFSGPYDPNLPAVDRLYQATTDFITSRTWPKPLPRQLSAEKLWDEFRVFVGLKGVLPAWIRAERNKAKDAVRKGARLLNDPLITAGQGNDSGGDSEDDEDFSDSDELGPIIPTDKRPDAEEDTKKAEDSKAGKPADGPTETDASAEDEIFRKDERIFAFLKDPETVVKMFLSSYMRKQGLIWSDPNLDITPRVLFFFFRFLLRNRVLPELENELKNALAIVERAQTELPHSSVVAKIIPCDVGSAFRDHFGQKAENFGPLKIQWDEDGKKDNSAPETNVADVRTADVPLEDMVMEYVGDGEFNDVLQPTGAVQLEAAGIAQIEEVVEDERSRKRARLEGDEEGARLNDGAGESAPLTSADGTTTPNENTNDNDLGAWGSGGGWDTGGLWGHSGDAVEDNPGTAEVDWSVPVYTLSKFLGMTVLPFTHVTGVVEWGMRRIVSVQMPNRIKRSVGDADQDWAANAAGVEEEFGARLVKVVFAPWYDWDVPVDRDGIDDIRKVYSEIYRGTTANKGIKNRKKKGSDEQGDEGDRPQEKPNPEDYYDDEIIEGEESSKAKIIWENTRGWVVDSESGDVVFSDASGGKMTKQGRLPVGGTVHDPLKDTIEVLFDPAVAEKLRDSIGMGLGGTWVQLIREGAVSGSDMTGDARKRYWYLEELKIVIPSFYIA
ncbi:hypothetical protein AX17_002104 [Amanita inopinata Kibby_2008]|nr:hypothetical protein AX17_002104 [Amanita inopinata Kibby_2008]